MQITIDSKKYRELLFSRKKENFGKFIRKTYGSVFADLMKATAIRKIVISSSCLNSVIPNNISYNEIMSLAVPSTWLANFSINETSLAAYGVLVKPRQQIQATESSDDSVQENSEDSEEHVQLTAEQQELIEQMLDTEQVKVQPSDDRRCNNPDSLIEEGKESIDD